AFHIACALTANGVGINGEEIAEITAECHIGHSHAVAGVTGDEIVANVACINYAVTGVGKGDGAVDICADEVTGYQVGVFDPVSDMAGDEIATRGGAVADEVGSEAPPATIGDGGIAGGVRADFVGENAGPA